jgi:hypothetical protein
VGEKGGREHLGMMGGAADAPVGSPIHGSPLISSSFSCVVGAQGPVHIDLNPSGCGDGWDDGGAGGSGAWVGSSQLLVNRMPATSLKQGEEREAMNSDEGDVVGIEVIISRKSPPYTRLAAVIGPTLSRVIVADITNMQNM